VFACLLACAKVKEKLAWGEYLIVLITFVAINILGLNPGLVFGVFCSVINFVITYALYNSSRSGPQQVKRLYRRSITLHHPNQVRN
jgi:MFS superfamily sulfate permease-like transporter